MKRNIWLLIIVCVLSSFIIVAGCEKAPEEEHAKVVDGSITQKQVPESEPEALSVPEPGKTETKTKHETAVVSLLTEAEQDFVDDVEGHSEATHLEGVDVLKFLKILVKGNPDTIRWYKENYDSEEKRKEAYGIAIAESFGVLDLKNNRQAFDLALKIIRTKQDQPIAVANAAGALGYVGDISVIPLLRELTKESDIWIKYNAAGALLALGDADTSLPILDKAAEGGYLFGVNALFQNGKLLDERGKENLVKALTYSHAEVAMTAAMRLYDLGIERKKCEEAALKVVNRLIYKKNKDYGFEIIGGPSNPEWVVLPEYNNKKLEDVEAPFRSDRRGCAYAIRLLGEFRSKDAVPLLEYIKNNNSEPDCLCWENAANNDAKIALDNIKGGY